MTGNSIRNAAETENLSEHFRRTDPRYDRRVEVEIIAGSTRQTAVTKNISLGGMYIESLEPLPMLAKVVVRFRVPTQNEMVEVAGQVRWLEPGSTVCGVGIRFDGLRAREVWALNRFFQS
ncbi:MAG: PilZ domain-containing protein [Deltaproteobacteria bacterium]|nr:PilZ domain-containing protein [Deltaproteobacteria bacterium]